MSYIAHLNYKTNRKKNLNAVSRPLAPSIYLSIHIHHQIQSNVHVNLKPDDQAA